MINADCQTLTAGQRDGAPQVPLLACNFYTFAALENRLSRYNNTPAKGKQSRQTTIKVFLLTASDISAG